MQLLRVSFVVSTEGGSVEFREENTGPHHDFGLECCLRSAGTMARTLNLKQVGRERSEF